MLRRNFIFILFVIFCQLTLSSQNITPVGVSNYATTQSLFISPSLNGSSEYNWHVNLAGVWANVNNNFLSLNMPYSLYRVPNRVPIQFQTENGNPAFEKQWIREHLNGNNKHVSATASVYGPSASIKIRNARIGVFTQGYAGVRVVGVSENLAHAIYNEMDSAQDAFRFFNDFNSGLDNQIDKITIAANTAAAIGFNASYNFPLKWDRNLIAGISVKRAYGFNAAHFHSAQMNTFSNFRDSVYLDPTSIELSEFGRNEVGKGWGYDIGATYVFHKKEFKRNGPYHTNNTRYFSKFSIAFMDIGSVKYNEVYTASASLDRRLGINVDSFELDINENNYPEVLDSMFAIHGSYAELNQAQSLGLPTRFVVSFDRQVKKHLFINGTWSQSLRKRHSRHMRYQSTLMIAPRWEWRYFEVSTPLELAYDYRAIRLGTNIRLGPLYLGTNSVLPFLYTKGFRDADFFIGIAFGNIPGNGLREWFEERDDRIKAKKKSQGCPEF